MKANCDWIAHHFDTIANEVFHMGILGERLMNYLTRMGTTMNAEMSSRIKSKHCINVQKLHIDRMQAEFQNSLPSVATLLAPGSPGMTSPTSDLSIVHGNDTIKPHLDAVEIDHL